MQNYASDDDDMCSFVFYTKACENNKVFPPSVLVYFGVLYLTAIDTLHEFIKAMNPIGQQQQSIAKHASLKWL